jgi:hypothetical protein
MKSLKYLSLNIAKGEFTCENCNQCESISFYYLCFNKSEFLREKPLSHLETIIIGGELF